MNSFLQKFSEIYRSSYYRALGQCGNMRNLLLLIFSSNQLRTYLVISLVKPLLSRNFAKKCEIK